MSERAAGTQLVEVQEQLNAHEASVAKLKRHWPNARCPSVLCCAVLRCAVLYRCQSALRGHS